MTKPSHLEIVRQRIRAKKHIRKHQRIRIVWKADEVHQAMSVLQAEADQTRWALLSKGVWGNEKQVMKIPFDESDEKTFRVICPLSDKSDLSSAWRKARFYLDSDATILEKTRFGITVYEPDGRLDQIDEIEWMIHLLRVMRKE